MQADTNKASITDLNKPTEAGNHFSFRVLLCAILLLLLISCSSGIPKIVETYEVKSVFNGYLHVSFKGDILFQGVVGNTYDQVKKPEMDSPVYLASLTKLFTKLAILQLENGGKLDLDQTISEVWPHFQPTFGQEVTVRHLLEMKSGLPRELHDGESLTMVRYDDHKRGSPYLDTIRDISLSGTPGETVAYSNLGYWLLGAVIEVVTSSNLDEAYRTLLFEPYDLEQSGLHQMEMKPLPSYSFQGNSPQRDTTNYSGRYASGGAYSSVKDMIRLAETLGSEFVDSENLLFGKNERLEHYGSLPNATNVFVVDRKADFCFIFLNNSGIADLSEITNLLNEVQVELGIEVAPTEKRKIKVDAMSTLRDSVPLEHAMLEWSKALEEGDEQALFEILNSVSEQGAFDQDEATWSELSRLPKRFSGWKTFGYRLVRESPAGYEIWYGAETGEKMAIRWISSEQDPGLIHTIFIQPDDMEWMGKDF